MNNRTTGTYYEQKAADFLAEQHVKILDRNFRCRYGEIDLIGKDNRYLVFFEVKFRSTGQQGLPEEAVTLKKQKIISFVSKYYCLTHHILDVTPMRFDIISICGDQIRWIQNAFDYRG